MLRRSIAPVAALWLAVSPVGCAWVTLTPEAESVRVASWSEALGDCEKRGNIRSQTRARVAFVARNTQTVSEELQSLARNSAVEMGADTIVAEGPPSVEGRQRFTAYRCS